MESRFPASGFQSSSACRKARSRCCSARAAQRSTKRSARWRKPARLAGPSIGSFAIQPSSLKSPAQRMLRQIGRNRPGFLGGVLAYLTFVVGLLAAPPEWLSIVRENSFDAVLLVDFELRERKPDRARVIVVDIDQRSLDALGPWPWPRETMARLVD